MKITETIERECCVPGKDLVEYKGLLSGKHINKPQFCKHCGQVWQIERYTDAAGRMDERWVKVPL